MLILPVGFTRGHSFFPIDKHQHTPLSPFSPLWEVCSSFFSSCIVILAPGLILYCLPYHVSGMTFLGVSQNIFHFMVVLSIMITIITLEDKAKAILLQFSHTVITSMELTRLYHHSGISFLHKYLHSLSTCHIDLLRFYFVCHRGIGIRKKYFRR